MKFLPIFLLLSVNCFSQDTTTQRIFNGVVQLYDNCVEEKQGLECVLDSCFEAHNKAGAVIASQKKELSIKDTIIENQNIASGVKDEIIENGKKILKHEKKKGRNKTWGGVAGGTGLGALIATIVFIAVK